MRNTRSNHSPRCWPPSESKVEGGAQGTAGIMGYACLCGLWPQRQWRKSRSWPSWAPASQQWQSHCYPSAGALGFDTSRPLQAWLRPGMGSGVLSTCRHQYRFASFKQWFAYLVVHWNPLEAQGNTNLKAPSPEPCFTDSDVDLGTCNLDMFPCDMNAAVSGLYFGNPWLKAISHGALGLGLNSNVSLA